MHHLEPAGVNLRVMTATNILRQFLLLIIEIFKPDVVNWKSSVTYPAGP